MTPLGPLNGKNFGTIISPWVVTLDALKDFKVPGPPRQNAIPNYLEDPGNCMYSIRMKAEIVSRNMSTITCESDTQSLYWTMRQIVAHLASAGSAIRTGDVLATGTVSGPNESEYGCLLETTRGGKRPITLADGSQRAYLEDGDIVRMSAIAGDLSSGVGFGECVSQLLPSA
jgi:fumarylacetoacetase